VHIKLAKKTLLNRAKVQKNGTVTFHDKNSINNVNVLNKCGLYMVSPSKSLFNIPNNQSDLRDKLTVHVLGL